MTNEADAPGGPAEPATVAGAEQGAMQMPQGGEALAASAAPAGGAVPRTRLQFTGEGREYFRIWVVNLLLTLASLGIYSAWAKVRKTRYFYQNTRLHGHAFDYHGAPGAILRGRALAVVLLAAYTWSFEISRAVGLATIVVLCLAGPWLFMRAQQFKFRNSSWRGLRFGFDSRLTEAYRRLLPLLLIWFSGSVAGALLSPEALLLGALGLATALLWPWMHHALKRYQHSRIRYGTVASEFRPALRSVYWVYSKAVLLMFAAAGLGTLVMFAAAQLATHVAGSFGTKAAVASGAVAMIVGGTIVLFVYLGCWPYFAARMQQVVWGNTRLGAVGFVAGMRAWPFARLVARCVAFTLFTCGLYWPFAAVALARYRIESMEVITPGALEDAAAVVAAPPAAAGEAAVDLFGLDVGL